MYSLTNILASKTLTIHIIVICHDIFKHELCVKNFKLQGFSILCTYLPDTNIVSYNTYYNDIFKFFSLIILRMWNHSLSQY